MTSTKLVTALLLVSAIVRGDTYSGQQCPNFATTEQPYLYLYTSEWYQGYPLYVTNANIPDLGHLPQASSYSSFYDDKASSLRVRGKWRICTSSSYGGACVDVSSSSWKSELMVESLAAKFGDEYDDSISSIKLLSCSQY